MKISSIVSFFFLAATANLQAQTLPDSVVKKIDRLHNQWDKKNSPGAVVGIVRNDSLIFAKGYGMASLEYGVQLSPQTEFQLGSISKQFTGYCVLLLEREGKLRLDDDIRKYLPWFPDMKEKITIYQLLHHTSGVREVTLYGPGGGDEEPKEPLKKAIIRQTTLNYKPGERYSYCSTGFNLLGEIVRAVSGKSIRRFADSAIFKPLHMDHTFYNDIRHEVIPNLASGYMPSGDNHYWLDNETGGPVMGGSGVVTNMEDMAKWIIHFYHHPKEDDALIAEMVRKGKLNNGEKVPYGAGIALDAINGQIAYSHTGKAAGYNTYMAVLPAQRTGFIELTNIWDYNNGPFGMLINLLAPDQTSHKAAIAVTDTLSARLSDTVAVRKFAGDYMTDDGQQFSISLKNGFLYAGLFGQQFLMKKAAKDTFAAVKVPFSIVLKGEGNNKAFIFRDEIARPIIKRIPVGDAELTTYTGTYYCPENDFTYSIVLENHKLKLTNTRLDDATITFVTPDELFNSNWWMYHMTMVRDSKKQITGFDVNVRSTYHLRYYKELSTK